MVRHEDVVSIEEVREGLRLHHSVNDSRLEIDEDCARHVVIVVGLVEQQVFLVVHVVFVCRLSSSKTKRVLDSIFDYAHSLIPCSSIIDFQNA